ncbi:MAG: TIGR00266 family protein [Deltaproteobacteria bacterium]|nr:TIGR00266 family protein [Deltaproteobacteria bacterium]
MDFNIISKGAFATLNVSLQRGESIKAESGAMITMSDTLDVNSKMESGIIGGLARKLLAGESLFFQTLKAERGDGDAMLASAYPGEMAILELDGSEEYILQKDGFLAAEDSVTVSTKAQNLTKGLFSGEGFFVMRLGGAGKVVVSTYGGIMKLSLAPGEVKIIDNSHMVAWSANSNYKIEKASKGWISSFTSGEGLVCRFEGPGDVYIQTRNSPGFGSWVKQFIPAKG